jgi:hypothetical protein
VPSGVTSSTPTNLVVGAGVAYVDGSILGATADDNVFRIERDYFTPDLNGTKGALIGTDYITRSEGVLETSIPEISAAIFASLWPASTNTGGTISEDETRRIPTADYHDWELQVERLNGGYFGFAIDGGINLGNLEITLGDASLAAPRAEIHARWDASNLAVAPQRIVVADGS